MNGVGFTGNSSVDVEIEEIGRAVDSQRLVVGDSSRAFDSDVGGSPIRTIRGVSQNSDGEGIGSACSEREGKDVCLKSGTCELAMPPVLWVFPSTVTSS